MGVLTDKINAANTLGRENLAEKGVELPEAATTYEIMQGIANVESGGAKSYADMVYEHFGVSKEEYPYLFIAHDISSNRSNIELSFAKTFSQSSGGTIMLTDFLRAEKGSISPNCEDTTERVVYLTMAYLGATNLTPTASGYVVHSTRDNTYTNTEIELTNPDKYTLITI